MSENARYVITLVAFFGLLLLWGWWGEKDPVSAGLITAGFVVGFALGFGAGGLSDK